MEELTLDLVDIVCEMDEKEKKIFEEESAATYFYYINKDNTIKNIVSKLDSSEEIDDKEWFYLLKKLFVVSCKAKSEEERIDLSYKILEIICKIGSFITSKNSSVYREFNIMLKYINYIRLEQELNSDLLYGLNEVWSSKSKDDLKVLLKQHTLASNFRESKNRFDSEFAKCDIDCLSNNAIVSFNSIERFYTYEKELVKTYK